MVRATVVAVLCLALVTVPSRAADGPKELWEAAQQGDTPRVKALLDAGLEINARTPAGTTPLIIAAAAGQLEVVQLLLERKADIAARDFDGTTALNAAMQRKQPAVAKALLEAGAAAGPNILGNVAQSGSVELVQLILDKFQPRPQQIAQALQWTWGPDALEVRKLLITTLLKSGEGQVETAIATAARMSNQSESVELLQLAIETAKPGPGVLANVLDALGPQQLIAQKLILQKVLETGGADVDVALASGARRGNIELVRTVLQTTKPQLEVLNSALAATYEDQSELIKLLTDAGAQGTPKPVVRVDEQTLQSYTGTYVGQFRNQMQIAFEDGRLVYKSGDRVISVLQAVDQVTFHPVGNEATQYSFQQENGKVVALVMKAPRLRGGSAGSFTYRREEGAETVNVKPQEAPAIVSGPAVEELGIPVPAPQNWPSFRGSHAAGTADGQYPPTKWDVERGIHIRWKTPIPGLGHASPIVWNDRIFLATAVPIDAEVRIELGGFEEGIGSSTTDSATYSRRVLCLDKHSGRILWERIAHEGPPQVKRHPKATFANATAVTDGNCVAVCFGSEGIFCYDFEGNLLWRQGLGLLDAGWSFETREYGFAGSPIIHQGLVIVQCDWGKEPCLVAFSTATGKRVWQTLREEPLSYCSPTLVEVGGRAQIVANSLRNVRSYDPLTGAELWRLTSDSWGAAVPTPVAGHGLIYIAHGSMHAERPVFAIRAAATGDVSLSGNQASSDQIAWSVKRDGPFLSTPLVYGDQLYCLSHLGILNCLDANTGKSLYRQRLGGGVGYAASPIAADGKIYLTCEDGSIKVVKAGPAFELLAVNEMGDACLATPAISDGMLFVRTQKHLYGIGRKLEP